MTEIEGNKLIAEFMDTNHRVSSWEGREDVILIYPLDSEGYKLPPIVADYKGSWDWLMPCVEKIGQDEDLRGQIDLSINYFFEGDIKSVWLAVVEVISSNKK